jgi:hypothetical protein
MIAATATIALRRTQAPQLSHDGLGLRRDAVRQVGSSSSGRPAWEGFSGLSLKVFTEMTPPPGGDGLLNPIIGSLPLTVLAVAIGTPIGIWRARTWPNTAVTTA